MNKLGIRYLWVDALCIIQDSSKDMDEELRVMVNIFRCAFVTISAKSAFRADQGFLPYDRPADVLPFRLADRSMPPGRMLLQYHHLFPARKEYQYRVPALDQRGWCFQETLLSPRTLIFDPPNIGYKCRSFDKRKIHDLDSDKPTNGHVLFPTNKNHERTSSVARKVDDQAIRDEWNFVLWNYSRRKTTEPSDKFIALASIVDIFRSISDDEYIAGLWRRNLLFDLLWRVDPDNVRLPRPQGYCAPS